MADGFGVPRVDLFSPLAQLGQQLGAASQDSARREMLGGIKAVPGSPGFLAQLGEGLLRQGDVNGALAVTRLMEANQDRTYQRQQDSMNWDWRRQEAGRQEARDERDFSARREDATANRQRQTSIDALTNYYRQDQASRANQQLEIQRQAAERAAKEAEAKASAIKALPAELGARVALGQSFLDQAPELRKKIEAGGMTGIWDASVARAGRGDPGEILRQWRSGKEAVIRNLTGAGMNESEIKTSVAQYEPSFSDDAATALKKFDMLTDQLKRIEAEAYRGRGVPDNRHGKNQYFEGAAGAAPAPAPGGPAAPAPANPNRVDSFDAIPENRRYRDPRDGKVYRKVNGQAVPE